MNLKRKVEFTTLPLCCPFPLNALVELFVDFPVLVELIVDFFGTKRGALRSARKITGDRKINHTKQKY